MRLATRLAMLAMAMLSATVVTAAMRLGVSSSLGPGPGFFPFALGLLLGLLALLWIALDLVRGGPEEWPEGPPPRGASALRLLGLVALLLGVLVLLVPLGFSATVFLMSCLLLPILDERRLAVILPVALAAGPGVSLLFTRGLGVELPAAPFGVFGL